MESTAGEPKKRIVFIGSSGGGTATLGHTNASEFVKAIDQHLSRGIVVGTHFQQQAAVKLECVLFVSMDDGSGFDGATGTERATLLYMRNAGSKEESFHDSLDTINDKIKELEKEIAKGIKEKNIDGLICVSCEPSLFPQTFSAASSYNLPVAGTGGTSLSEISSKYKIQLIGNSGGSVATTPETKAVSFASAFSQHWDLKYNPWNVKAKRKLPTWRSVLNSCLPAFWSVALLKRLLTTTPILEWVPEMEMLLVVLESYTLPTVCAVIMATSRRETESVAMAAILAACACRKTIVGGLLVGFLVATLEEHLLYMCLLQWNLPATMTNLLTSGFVGIMTAVLISPFTPYLSMATEMYRDFMTTYIWSASNGTYGDVVRLFILSLLGSVTCYGSKIGWYHSIFLPIILIEMEVGDASMLGTLDFLTLVLVCSGVCLGLLLTGSDEERRLAKRGITINLLCGDFIEACYPHMEEHTFVSMGGYLASSISASILSESCKSSAYLPFPVALWLADDWRTLLIASVIVLSISFLSTVLNYFLFIRNSKKD